MKYRKNVSIVEHEISNEKQEDHLHLLLQLMVFVFLCIDSIINSAEMCVTCICTLVLKTVCTYLILCKYNGVCFILGLHATCYNEKIDIVILLHYIK